MEVGAGWGVIMTGELLSARRGPQSVLCCFFYIAINIVIRSYRHNFKVRG